MTYARTVVNYARIKFMRLLVNLLLTLTLTLGFQYGIYGQGTLVFNNLGPADGKVFVFDGFPGVPPGTRALLNQDINFDLELLPADGSTPVVVRTWLLSNGTASGINAGPGLFADPTQSVIPVPGTEPGEVRSLAVGAWVGDYPTLQAAVHAGVAVSRGSPFTLRLGSLQSPPASLIGMPELNVGIIPEPPIFNIAMLGLALFFLDRISLLPKKILCKVRNIFLQFQDCVCDIVGSSSPSFVYAPLAHLTSSRRIIRREYLTANIRANLDTLMAVHSFIFNFHFRLRRVRDCSKGKVP